MPRLVVTRAARRDLERLRQFLQKKNPDAARRAANAIKDAINGIVEKPEAHRPVPDRMFHREIIIEFGGSGYIARYYHRPGTEEVIVLRIKHQLEDDFSELA
jgi:plasmid stabilization system protein ParE